MKTFTGFSGRRATTDIRECRDKGLIKHAAHYNSIFNAFERSEMTPLLKELVEESASPLKSVEKNFAADATGFETRTFYRWLDHAHGRERKEQAYIKAHALVGTHTHIATSVNVTIGTKGDAPELPSLLTSTSKRFDLERVSADKGYLSGANVDAIAAVGATPYIPFKINSRGEGSENWRKMFHLYSYHQDEFRQHYHQRSNVETVFSMVKKKFGPAVRAKLPTAQLNEVLCKFLCHNLSVLVHSFYELGIDPQFATLTPAVRVRVQ